MDQTGSVFLYNKVDAKRGPIVTARYASLAAFNERTTLHNDASVRRDQKTSLSTPIDPTIRESRIRFCKFFCCCDRLDHLFRFTLVVIYMIQKHPR